MPLLGIDCRFAGQKAGLGTFTRSMVGALLRRDDPWSYVLFTASDSEPWVAEFALRENVSVQTAPYPHYSFAEQWHLPILLRETGCDLFYAPHFNVPYLCTTPFICTVHDLILHRFPNQAGLLRKLVYRMILSHAVAASKAVVAVSETTKRDLVSFYPASAAKTAVIHNGVDARFRRASDQKVQEVRKTYGLPARFLLYVGNCKEHKNVAMLLRAFTAAKLDGVELVLVSSGKECDALALPASVRRIASVEEADLPALYSASIGCVTASLAEGFGLPMAEAMATRTPVIATKCGSLPEILGNQALLVEPTEQALADGIRRIVSDRSLTDSVRLDAAEARAHRYDWDSSAALLADLFARTLSSLSHG